jgi:hypothetical protein
MACFASVRVLQIAVSIFQIMNPVTKITAV